MGVGFRTYCKGLGVKGHRVNGLRVWGLERRRFDRLQCRVQTCRTYPLRENCKPQVDNCLGCRVLGLG